VDQPTVLYDGAEIPDFGERRFPYAVIEVTKHCNLRCKTCFFFQAFQHEDKNLPEQELLAKLSALQKRHLC
jgi:molybdenum cofactor biosynthesis enzyme MoaA